MSETVAPRWPGVEYRVEDEVAIVSLSHSPVNGLGLPVRRGLVAAFEAARSQGLGCVELDGSLLEVPTYSNARRLIARGEALRAIDRNARA